MIIETGSLIKGLLIVLNRIASWFGSGYFIKKGMRHGKIKYFLLALGVSLAMFVLLMSSAEGRAMMGHLEGKAVHFFSRLVHGFKGR